jgi:alkylation response protein AidB-like acyl-CoA dehydrogenase
MNQVISQKNINYLESLKIFYKKSCTAHRKMGKTGQLNASYGKVWRKLFGISYPEVYGLNLDLFYTVIFLEELQKIKSSGFAAAMWAHSYLAMTH